jgi:cell division protein FtsZ
MHRRSFLRTLVGATLGWVVSSSALARLEFSADRLVAPRGSRIDLAAIPSHSPVVKVVGIGGAGNRVLEQLMLSGLTGVATWISIDTNASVIARSHANIKLYFENPSWLGSRHNLPHLIGRVEHQLADHERAAIAHALVGADAVCLMAGLGGSAATRLAPQVATLAHEVGALTAAVVTTPFSFEGGRNRIARTGLAELQRTTDTIVSLSNELGLWFLPDDVSVLDAYDAVDRLVIDCVTSQIRSML